MAEASGIFDVRTTFPAGCDLDNPTVKASVHRINLMIFLLEGINYRDLYTTDFGPLVLRLVPRLEEACEAGLVTSAQRDQILGGGKQLAEAVAGSNLTMKKMLVTPRDELPGGIWEPSRKIWKGGISLPYLDQADDKKAEAQGVFDDGFLNDNTDAERPGVGNMTDRDLYTTRAQDYPKVHAIIQRAKGAGVLDVKPNNYACDWPNCVPYPNLFCTMVDNACSLESDPLPGE